MIKILDCTLRDGGYVNDWYFGSPNITKIVESLCGSGVEIIELGFVNPLRENNDDFTIKPSIKEFNYLVCDNSKLYTVMINYGECVIDDFCDASETKIKAIRLAFKKKDKNGSFILAKELIKKGYKVFLQPMVSLSYSREEFKDLIQLANDIKAYAFYIVDSFGEMNEKDLSEYLSIANQFLDRSICLGFHSHNNLQLSFSNCKFFINHNNSHCLIVDSSIYGMGRGAGNLNTEIFLDYLNNYYGKHYLIHPIINIIDLYFDRMHKEKFWGYSIPYYISAKNHVHPNYATFLDNKKTLTYLDIEKIIMNIDQSKKDIFDKQYIANLYLEYQGQNKRCNHDNLKQLLINKVVVLVGPGPSSKNDIDLSSISGKYIVIGVNHYPKIIAYDYCFFSNDMRYNQFGKKEKTIITSNVNGIGDYIVPYFELINDNDLVFDNSLLMCLKLLINYKVKKVYLVGFDGYSGISENDYVSKDMMFKETLDKSYLNKHIKSIIDLYRQNISISFITYSAYNTE